MLLRITIDGRLFVCTIARPAGVPEDATSTVTRVQVKPGGLPVSFSVTFSIPGHAPFKAVYKRNGRTFATQDAWAAAPHRLSA